MVWGGKVVYLFVFTLFWNQLSTPTFEFTLFVPPQSEIGSYAIIFCLSVNYFSELAMIFSTLFHSTIPQHFLAKFLAWTFSGLQRGNRNAEPEKARLVFAMSHSSDMLGTLRSLSITPDPIWNKILLKTKVNKDDA